MSVPDDVGALLGGFPDSDSHEQAFPVLSVDELGFPHVALLSRAELGLSTTDQEILAVVGSARTKANISRDGRATLIAIGGTTAHYLKLRLARSMLCGSALGCAFHVVGHKRDTLGIPLTPIGFRTTEALARAEQWVESRKILETLATGGGRAGMWTETIARPRK